MVTNWGPSLYPVAAYMALYPVWIQLLGLPIELWNEDHIIKIVEAVGYYRNMDNATLPQGKKGQKAAFARALIELDISKELISKVILQLPEGNKIQKIFYENLPERCANCSKPKVNNYKCVYCNHIE